MFYKFNDIFGKTLTVNLNESNLFEMRTREVTLDNNLLHLTTNSIINFYFNYRLLPKFSSVVSAKFKFDISNGDAVFNINNEYSMVSFTNRIIDSFKFSEKVEIDLINYFSIDGGFYFSIDPKSEFSINKNSICLEFSYISLEESIVNQEYLIEAFSDFSYRLNVRNGKVNYYYNLLNISNSSFHVDLKLIYDLDFNSASVNSMPLGFKFNFCETVWYNFDDNTYFYEDKNGDKHVFIKSKNDDNAYVDVAGTYLVLHVYNDRFEILNGNISHIFDKNGYLTKITKKIFMDGYINVFSLILSYDSNYNLIKIIEENNIKDKIDRLDLININYINNKIIISSAGFLDTELVKDEENKLAKITKMDRFTKFIYNNSNCLLTVNNDNHKNITFNYNNNLQIKTIKEETNDFELISENNIFYSYLSTNVRDNFGNVFKYIFDNEGKLLSKVEVVNSNNSPLVYYKKLENDLLYYRFSNDRFLAYEDIKISSNYNTIETTERFRDTSLSKDNLVFERDKEYILVFSYNNTGFKRNQDKLDYTHYSISINQDGHLVSERNLVNSYYDRMEVIRFKAISGSYPYIYFQCGYFESQINITNLRIFEVNEVINNKYLNKYTNDNNSLEINNISFYPYNNKQFYCDGKYFTNFVYFNDLVQNIKNFKLKENNTFDCFYNRGRGLISNISNFLLDSYSGPLAIEDLILGDYIKNDDLINFKYYDFKDEEYFRKVDIIKSKEIEKITNEIVYSKNNNIIVSFDENRLVTKNTYDDYCNLIETKTYNLQNEQKFYVSKYKFKKKNIISNINYINDKEVIQNFTYDDNELNLLKLSANDEYEINYEYYDNLYLKKIYMTVDNLSNENNIKYELDNIKSLNANNNIHEFLYDKYDKLASYKDLFKITRQIVNKEMIETLKYNDNSYECTNIYDQYGRLVKVKENNDIIKYVYSNKFVDYIIEDDDKTNVDFMSKLRMVKDLVIKNEIKYYYDKYNNVTKVLNSNLDHYFNYKSIIYDEIKRITSYDIAYKDLKFRNSYNYEDNLSNVINKIELTFNDNTICKTIKKDMYYRIKNMDLSLTNNLNICCEIDYLDDNNSLNNLVKTITYFKNGSILDQYEINYDDFGKIIRLKNNQNENNYSYDKLGRLIKEINQKLKIENSYTYDNNGNLLTVVEKLENKEIVNRYEYLDSNKDLLIKYNNLDINYKNNNIVSVGDIKYEYIKNKYLSKVSLSDTEIVTYNYDSFGNRTYKTYNKDNSEVVHKYLLDEDKILRETINEKTIDYIYLDTNLIGFIYNENIYYYLKNVFGDITTILDNNGNVVGKYNYDSYGTCYIEIDQNGIATVNPFRYRSYYYDNETNLYYCKNRYYSPELGRFIQPAYVSTLNPSSINGLNLYSFANNNPIGIAYSSFGATFGTSGGMIGSTRGTIGNIVGSESVGGGSKISGFASLGGSSSSSINWLKANSVAMTHYTTSLIKNPFISWMLGNISYTETVQLNSAETFYSFSNIGNDSYSAGIGFNFGNWYGESVYVSSDIGFGSSWQLTPWLTGSSGWSLENGISISGGVIIGDTTHEITVSIGNGELLGYAACAGIAAILMPPGAREVAITAACIIFIIDLFN